MLRLNRIWKLYLVYSTVLLVMMILGGFILKSQLRETLRNYLARDALTLSRVIAKSLPNTDNSTVLDHFSKEYAETAGARITIIRTNGSVIGESDRNSIDVKNHLDRPEVRDALENGTGIAIRHSRTLGVDMLYGASLLKERDRIIRVAIPMREVKHIENEVMIFLTLALYLTPILAMIISFLFARYLTSDESEKT